MWSACPPPPPTTTNTEIGLDRAATIPGSRAKTSLAHQLELLRLQVGLAAELQRPVSVHCVRGYGHLLQLFSDLNSKPQQQQQQQQPAWPPAIMLHSYGGSVEEVARFCALPRGLGDAFFFSFSAAINGRTAPDKLRQRIAAVPDDRLLIESDQVRCFFCGRVCVVFKAVWLRAGLTFPPSGLAPLSLGLTLLPVSYTHLTLPTKA